MILDPAVIEFTTLVRLDPSPTNENAVIIPVVLTETKEPIPTDTSSSISTSSPFISSVFKKTTLSVTCLMIIGVALGSGDSIRICSIPRICFKLESRTIELVPILRIPVTLAFPLTTRSSENVIPEPTGSIWSLDAVATPTLIPRDEVLPNPRVSSSVWDPAPPEAFAPCHVFELELYCKNFPLTSAEESISSMSLILTAPPPPKVESCCWIRLMNNR